MTALLRRSAHRAFARFQLSDSWSEFNTPAAAAVSAFRRNKARHRHNAVAWGPMQSLGIECSCDDRFLSFSRLWEQIKKVESVIF